MGFSEAIKSVLVKYADFSGRARRAEYWFWTLAMTLGYFVAMILTVLAHAFFFIVIIFYLGILVPSLAVAVRRLHDTNRSGWYLLLGFIPIVGGIILLVFTVSDSTPGDNRFGPNPKGLGGFAGSPPPAYGEPFSV
jgi:uncharacterized membrane protein YhaH (DUF805 family)